MLLLWLHRVVHLVVDAVACAISRIRRPKQRVSLHAISRCETKRGKGCGWKLTFSIALLVGTSLDPFLPFLPLRINALFGYPVLDAAKAWTGVVAFLARFLAVCAGVLDLPALGPMSLSLYHAVGKGIHMHGHPRIRDWVNGHRRLNRVCCGGFEGIICIEALPAVRRGHGAFRI